MLKLITAKTSKAEFISAVKLVYDKSNLTENMRQQIFVNKISSPPRLTARGAFLISEVNVIISFTKLVWSGIIGLYFQSAVKIWKRM